MINNNNYSIFTIMTSAFLLYSSYSFAETSNEPVEDEPDAKCFIQSDNRYNCTIDTEEYISFAPQEEPKIKPDRWIMQHSIEVGLNASFGYVVGVDPNLGSLSVIYFYPFSKYYVLGAGFNLHVIVPDIQLENRFRLPLDDQILAIISLPIQFMPSFIGGGANIALGLRAGIQLILYQGPKSGFGLTILGGFDALFNKKPLCKKEDLFCGEPNLQPITDRWGFLLSGEATLGLLATF